MRGEPAHGAAPAPRPPSLLRSQPMYMIQMIVQADAAADTVEELGDAGTVMFCDLNEGAAAFQRSFVTQTKQCEEIERHLRYLEEQLEQAAPPRRRRAALRRWSCCRSTAPTPPSCSTT